MFFVSFLSFVGFLFVCFVSFFCWFFFWRTAKVSPQKNIRFYTKSNMYKFLLVLMFYGGETRTLIDNKESRIQDFERKSIRRPPWILYRKKTNVFVRNMVTSLGTTLATVKRCKLVWFAHVTRHDTFEDCSSRCLRWSTPQWPKEQLVYTGD